MPVARITDGREVVYAHAAGVAPGHWRITWETGQSIETEAGAARNRRGEVVLRVFDIPLLRRASQWDGSRDREGDAHVQPTPASVSASRNKRAGDGAQPKARKARRTR